MFVSCQVRERNAVAQTALDSFHTARRTEDARILAHKTEYEEVTEGMQPEVRESCITSV
jgi:hypothetical protein